MNSKQLIILLKKDSELVVTFKASWRALGSKAVISSIKNMGFLLWYVDLQTIMLTVSLTLSITKVLTLKKAANKYFLHTRSFISHFFSSDSSQTEFIFSGMICTLSLSITNARRSSHNTSVGPLSSIFYSTYSLFVYWNRKETSRKPAV